MYSINSYKAYPQLYDLLYQRYLKSVPKFVELVVSNTPPGGVILDLAAGTGEVSIPLLRKGFWVTSLDLSPGMLKNLKLKARQNKFDNFKIVAHDMQAINYIAEFDTVCIRQAINYFRGVGKLEAGLKHIYKALKPGGKFIFNAPHFKGEKHYPSIYNLYENCDRKAFVLETNKIEGRTLKHQQYSVIWEDDNKPMYVTDENTFYMFTKKEFESALIESGFSEVEWSNQNKTLYCVALK